MRKTPVLTFGSSVELRAGGKRQWSAGKCGDSPNGEKAAAASSARGSGRED